jgi:hypothetical protein
MAERVRFELTVRLNVRQISSLVHSTTLPPFLIRVPAISRLLLRGQNYSKPAEKRKSFFSAI